jgi:flagellar basal body L-ring protein FlgH
MKNSLLIILGSLLFTSCAGYINSIHRDLDRQEYARKTKARQGRDHFDRFRKGAPKRNIQMPTANRYSSRSRRFVEPTIKRKYRPASEAKKRMKANDLNDQGNYSSLWAGNGKENFLFTYDEQRKSGDIVMINVLSRLKNEITLELKKAFPAPPRPTKKPASEEEKGDGKKKTAKAAPAKPKEEGEKDEVYDRITGVVVEKINNQHMLVRGRKHLLFRNRKRLVEVQALVSERDITNQDAIDSDKILESTVNVIR